MDGVPYGQLFSLFRRHWLCLFLAGARKGAQLDASAGRLACLAKSFANAAGIARMMKKFEGKYPKLFKIKLISSMPLKYFYLKSKLEW